jgi:single-strand DNA-binding protein
MASFNKVILAGNLTRDPELRYTPKGTAVVKIGLAVNRTYTTESGERKEQVSFIDVEAWGRQAETLSQYMRKGRPLLVEGRLQQDTWEDKNTKQKQSKLKVVLESFAFIGSSRAEEGQGGEAPRAAANRPAPQQNAPAAPAPASEPDMPPPEEDDVPF